MQELGGMFGRLACDGGLERLGDGIAGVTDYLQEQVLDEMGAVSGWHCVAATASLLRRGLLRQGRNSGYGLHSGSQASTPEETDSDDDGEIEHVRSGWQRGCPEEPQVQASAQIWGSQRQRQAGYIPGWAL